MPHYHIRWSNSMLDWKPFPTSKEAQAQAEQLVRLGVGYVIEQVDGDCPRCSSPAMKNKQPEHIRQEMLSGWKDIAGYLGKGARTVQRYERELGLPVRRPSGHRIGAVIALKSDLDSWVKSLPSGKEALNGSQRLRQEHLVSELAKRSQERLHLHDQMMTLRKELITNIRTVRESVEKLHQRLYGDSKAPRLDRICD